MTTILLVSRTTQSYPIVCLEEIAPYVSVYGITIMGDNSSRIIRVASRRYETPDTRCIRHNKKHGVYIHPYDGNMHIHVHLTLTHIHTCTCTYTPCVSKYIPCDIMLRIACGRSRQESEKYSSTKLYTCFCYKYIHVHDSLLCVYVTCARCVLLLNLYSYYKASAS
jgi:hypothetical protein